MKTIWVKSGNSYYMGESSQQIKKLEKGIYRLHDHPMRGLYLEKTMDSFEFPYKIYGVQNDFVSRVKKSWDNTTGNMGILLNGIKGTGKTVTAELICNQMDLPVIIVPFKSEVLATFLNSIQQDIVVFIDEYEKIYNEYNSSLLSVMDGVLVSDSRIMFLLTTNSLRIEQNMLQRPSRIRYVKTYGDLTIDVIMEVVKDTLIHKHLYKDTVKMISELPIITMDLVKSIVQEVNIHEESPYDFKEIFNANGKNDDEYTVYQLNENGVNEELYKYVTVSYSTVSSVDINREFYAGGRFLGDIVQVLSPTTVVVKRIDVDDNGIDIQTFNTISWEKSTKIHSSFANFAF